MYLNEIIMYVDTVEHSMQETSRLLGEDAEERQARQMVMQRQKEQRTVPQNQSKKKEHWER